MKLVVRFAKQIVLFEKVEQVLKGKAGYQIIQSGQNNVGIYLEGGFISVLEGIKCIIPLNSLAFDFLSKNELPMARNDSIESENKVSIDFVNKALIWDSSVAFYPEFIKFYKLIELLSLIVRDPEITSTFTCKIETMMILKAEDFEWRIDYTDKYSITDSCGLFDSILETVLDPGNVYHVVKVITAKTALIEIH